jgi:hypothetical protein
MDRGHALLAMAVVQTIAGLVVGPLDRVFNSRKWVTVVSAGIALVALVGLAAIPGLSLAAAVGLLLLLSAASAYGSVLLAHIRSHFPDHLAGRGATTGNMAQLIGAALLPMLTGLIPPLFPHAGPGYSPLAYQWIFAILAVALGVGLGIYSTARDSRPHAAPSTVAPP